MDNLPILKTSKIERSVRVGDLFIAYKTEKAARLNLLYYKS